MWLQPKDITKLKIRLKQTSEVQEKYEYSLFNTVLLNSGKCTMGEINAHGEICIYYRNRGVLAWMDPEDFEFITKYKKEK